VCTHEIEDPVRGHKGTIEVTLVFPGVECHASIFGTYDGDGTPPMCQLTSDRGSKTFTAASA
jgi:acetylornithine deacetylase/succinyl-diaminopimelate desuccinylase-like protein